MRFAYADPPYFGQGRKRYGDHPDAGMFDTIGGHADLIQRLTSEFHDGWALSCNPRDLTWQLPLCPDDVRIAAWVKTWHQIRPTGVQHAWEPVIFRTAKKARPKPMVRDWLEGPVTRGTGVVGAKPHYFNRWVLDLVGFDPLEDEMVDLFPGTAGMASATAEMALL
jgi:hypothetical protein